MNYKTFIREGKHFKTLLTLTIFTKEERTSTRKNLEYLLDGQIFYPISTRPLSIKEIFEHNPITDKNTFKLILFVYGNEISPNVFTEYLYMFILNTPSKTKKRTHQIHWYASTQTVLFWHVSLIFLVFRLPWQKLRSLNPLQVLNILHRSLHTT